LTGMFVAIVFIAVFGLAGCGKSQTGSPPADKPDTGAVSTATAAPASAGPLDVARLRQVFASANPQLLIFLDETIAEIKARNYQIALGQMQRIGSDAKLTPEQKEAVQAAVLQLQGLASRGR